MTSIAQLHEHVRTLDGPGGPLHTVLTRPAEREPETAWLIASPSPVLGGDLTNNVTAALARAAAESGRAAVRFDYRNAGSSGGDTGGLPRAEWWAGRTPADGLEPLVDDALRVLERTQALVPVTCIVGYSFGGYVAAAVARRVPGLSVALVCPPLSRHGIPDWTGIEERALVVLADDDVLAPPPPRAELEDAAPRLAVVRLAGADHFLLDEEARAADAVLRFTGGDR